MHSRESVEETIIDILPDNDATAASATLSNLPKELWMTLTDFLSPKDIKRLSRVNREFHTFFLSILKHSRRPDILQWRIKHLNRMIEDYNDQIDDFSANNQGQFRAFLLLVCGGIMTSLFSYHSYKFADDSDPLSTDSRFLLNFMLFLSALSFLAGIIMTGINLLNSYQIHKMNSKIRFFQARIAQEESISIQTTSSPSSKLLNYKQG